MAAGPPYCEPSFPWRAPQFCENDEDDEDDPERFAPDGPYWNDGSQYGVDGPLARDLPAGRARGA